SFKAIQKIKALYPGVFTVLGVSNCSYGLKPKARKVLNSVYLFHAVKWGLDASIFHAGKVVSLDCVESSAKKICEDLIFNRRSDGYDPLHELINYFENDKLQDEKSSAAASLDPSEKLFSHVIEGKTKGLEETVSELLETTEPLEIINNILLSAMKQVGVRFQNGTTQLPFVLKSAEVVKKACSIVEPHIKSGEVNKKGTIVLATVKGDIHDIGKNLVDIILSNNGYTVHNIGTDRSAAEIAAAVDEIRPDAAGLSALLVKSALEMKNVAQFLSSNGMEIPLICGGAALTNDFVEKEVAPLNRKSAYYANDAFEAMNILEKLKNG
ncbi:MAG TPA: cobalamin-dependent protein, partial [bacterium]|nr:cobalamin-dependent protein [bacterium]